MPYASTTTLARIRAAKSCQGSWEALLKHRGKTGPDDEPIDLLTVLDSIGFGDALWVLSYAMPDDRLARHFQAWCAEQVLPLFEAERPGDHRIRDQIAMLRNDAAAPDERAAARGAAWGTARGAAWGAARAAARAAARDAARDAAWAAAWGAARDAARDAAWAAARDAARDAAWDAAWGAQEQQLRLMIAEQ